MPIQWAVALEKPSLVPFALGDAPDLDWHSGITNFAFHAHLNFTRGLSIPSLFSRILETMGLLCRKELCTQ
jgi:hypothetical protein